MAEESEEPTYLDQLVTEAFAADAADAGGERDAGRRGFFPILVGLMSSPTASDGNPSPPSDRIVLVNPLTQGMVVLQGDPDVVAGLLFDRLLGGRRSSGPPPASKASIAAMRTVDPGDLKPDEECPVCLEEFATGGTGEGGEEAEAVVKEVPCGHRFHGGCIEKWLGMHGSCPFCRFQMPAEEAGEPKKREGPAAAAAEEEEEDGGREGDGEMRERRRGESGVWVTMVYGRRNSHQSEGDGGAAESEDAYAN